MTHSYTITGMTCNSCVTKIKSALLKLPAVDEVSISLEDGEAQITMNEHLTSEELQEHITPLGTYRITEKGGHQMDTDTRSWWQTYKPIVLIFSYILVATSLVQLVQGGFQWMNWMRQFMGAFFLSFSFFKLLDLRAFADAYSSYDIIARRFRGWGYVYAFIELGLGLAFLTGIFPFWTNLVTCVVMSVSIIGVLQSVLNKQRIQCACLGTVFDLPMSTVTIIEDGLMILMSLTAVLHFLLAH